MTETQESPTKTLFDCLLNLYKQGRSLLMDADRLMGLRGWQAGHSNAPAGLSKSLNSPERWYARWATRFYMPAASEDEEVAIDLIPYVSIHFASDHNRNIDDPLVSAGRLLYHKAMNPKTADNNYDYWMCKMWFWGEPHATLEGWRQTGQGRKLENLKGSESFIVPLYDITSSEKLEELVIDRLLPADQRT